jgi:DNA gyrase subunit A
MAELKPIIEESFTQYSGAVLQSRALVDARDCLKPSARQIFYSMLLHKLTYNNKFKKTANAVGMALADFYIHGDSSCEGVIMRAGQDFAMRYPLVEVKGNMGSLIESGNWAAMRYTESRLSALSDILFKDIQKNTILDWRDSYDNTKKYPSVLPTKGYYNIVNGTLGIGIGMASSIPQFNLKEVNNALIKLLWNPNCEFEDIYCAPDFATGAILLNEKEVKESLKNGTGKACKLRSVVEYDEKERCFIVKEIPYGVYTNTICGQLEEIINDSDNNPGIDRFNDLTGSKPNIKIYLKRAANPERVLRFLYKNTSLQYYYSINMTMLEEGRFPKVFNWKTALQAHIDHEKVVYRNGFIFDLNKIKKRLHIIEGLLKALDLIDEVIQTIKTAADTANASRGLQQLLSIDEEQAKAILDIKLARLARLEVNKFLKEQNDLLIEKDRIENILHNEELLNKEIEKGFKEVINKYGDDRRTQIMNLSFSNEDEDEPIEEKELSIYLTNEGNLYTNETSTLYTQRRGGKGTKLKLNKNEYIVTSQTAFNADYLLAFSNKGKVYSLNLAEFPTSGRVNIGEFFILSNNEYITNIAPCSRVDKYKSVIFVTKNGLIKKTDFSEYKIKKSKGVIAIKLKDGDELVSTLFVNSENIGFLTKDGNFLIIDIEKINSIGRATSGVKGIKLSDNDYVVAARKIKNNCKEIISITKQGYISRTNFEEFVIGTRATKGIKIQKLKSENDNLSSFLPIHDKEEISIISNKGILTLKIKDISLTARGALGNISKKLTNNEIIINLM